MTFLNDLPPDLASVVEAWPTLAEPIRRAVLALLPNHIPL
jgi:hypothetical protein